MHSGFAGISFFAVPACAQQSNRLTSNGAYFWKGQCSGDLLQFEELPRLMVPNDR